MSVITDFFIFFLLQVFEMLLKVLKRKQFTQEQYDGTSFDDIFCYNDTWYSLLLHALITVYDTIT